MVGQEIFFQGTWFVSFYSRSETTNSLGENFEKSLIDFDLRPSRRGGGKYIFSVRLPTLCLHGEGSEEGGLVSC